MYMNTRTFLRNTSHKLQAHTVPEEPRRISETDVHVLSMPLEQLANMPDGWLRYEAVALWAWRHGQQRIAVESLMRFAESEYVGSLRGALAGTILAESSHSDERRAAIASSVVDYGGDAARYVSGVTASTQCLMTHMRPAERLDVLFGCRDAWLMTIPGAMHYEALGKPWLDCAQVIAGPCPGKPRSPMPLHRVCATKPEWASWAVSLFSGDHDAMAVSLFHAALAHGECGLDIFDSLRMLQYGGAAGHAREGIS